MIRLEHATYFQRTLSCDFTRRDVEMMAMMHELCTVNEQQREAA
jgi:hypothetical protein